MPSAEANNNVQPESSSSAPPLLNSSIAPLNAFSEAIDLNRLDIVQNIIERIQSGELKQTRIIKKSSNTNENEKNEKQKKSSEKDNQNNIIEVPLSITSCILASESLLEEEFSAYLDTEQQQNKLKEKKDKENKSKDKKKESESTDSHAKRLESMKVRRGDSNIHKAINAACLAHKSNPNNSNGDNTRILSYLLALLFPRGDSAVAVNLDDLDNLDNQLAIKADIHSALEIKNKLGSTPLHHACSHMNCPEDCIKLLIQYGADIAAKNLSGSTPLHCAAYIGNLTACELILESTSNSVKINLLLTANSSGLTPRDFARIPQIKLLFNKYIESNKSRPSSGYRPSNNIVINNMNSNSANNPNGNASGVKSRPTSATHTRLKSNIVINVNNDIKINQ